MLAALDRCGDLGERARRGAKPMYDCTIELASLAPPPRPARALFRDAYLRRNLLRVLLQRRSGQSRGGVTITRSGKNAVPPA